MPKQRTVTEKLDQIQAFQYDTSSSISVDALMASPGFKVQTAHYVYILTKYPEQTQELAKEIEKTLKRRGAKGASLEERVAIYFGDRAELSKLERVRLMYGIQVASNIASVVDNVVGVRAIGAEGRLSERSEERGINDLDLAVDFFTEPTFIETSLISTVAKDVEKKTGIKVDVLGPGIPITENSMEHVLAFFDEPLGVRGFPIYWREDRYLGFFLEAKNEYYDKAILEDIKAKAELKRKGLEQFS